MSKDIEVHSILSEPDVDGEGRDLYLITVTTLDQWATVLQPINSPAVTNGGFALLLAGDLSNVEIHPILELATWCITHGLFAVSVWGADCERVHDLFDAADVELGAGDTKPVVMSSWHVAETLPDALDFFWECSIADDGKLAGPSRIVLTVGNTSFEEDVRAWIRERGVH